MTYRGWWKRLGVVPQEIYAPYTGSAEANQEFANTSNQKNLEPTNMST